MCLFIRSVLLWALVACAMCPPLACQKKASSAKPAVSALDKTTLEAYVRHLFLWGPEVKVVIGEPKPSTVPGLSEVTVQASAGAASANQVFYVSRDGKKIMQGTVYDIADNPFRAELSKLNTASSPSLGTPGAPVVLVLFTDYQCPYCREEANTLRKNLLSTFPKEVRLYLKEFPLEQIHPWAKPAAIAGRCVFQQNPAAFWLYHDWVFEQQPQITQENLRAKVMTFAQGKEIDMLQLGRCMDTTATGAEVDSSIAEARALQINGTPTLFVNGRRLASQVPWPQLETIIRSEIEYQKTAKNAGDQACCEVTLSSPLGK
jgi:protein-disulfide isomerase